MVLVRSRLACFEYGNNYLLQLTSAGLGCAGTICEFKPDNEKRELLYYGMYSDGFTEREWHKRVALVNRVATLSRIGQAVDYFAAQKPGIDRSEVGALLAQPFTGRLLSYLYPDQPN